MICSSNFKRNLAYWRPFIPELFLHLKTTADNFFSDYKEGMIFLNKNALDGSKSTFLAEEKCINSHCLYLQRQI